MISIDSTRCVGCGLCVADCIQKNLFLQNGRAEARGDCFLCGHCAAICPQNAVSIPEYREDSTVEYRPETFDLPVENLLNTIKFRRSIRAYKSDPIEYEKLSLLAQAGRHAATAKNTQRCRFVFVQKELDIFKSIFWDTVREAISTETDPRLLRLLKHFYDGRNDFPREEYLFRNAPVVLFIGTDNALDAGLAAQCVELTAVSMGLGAMYNGYLCRLAAALPAVREWLGMQDQPPAAVMLLGYPDVRYARTAPRRPGDIEFR